MDYNAIKKMFFGAVFGRIDKKDYYMNLSTGQARQAREAKIKLNEIK